MNNEIFENWMKQPGGIKKLQAFLALSIILNLFLFMQILPNKAELKKAPEIQAQAKQEDNNKEANRQSKITEEELKEFINNYMQNFFSSKEDALTYLKTFSSEVLFEKSIKREIEARIKQGITSEFQMDDLFLDSISSNEAKVIILGREVFPKGDYQNRSFTIELIINTENIQVESIPVFKVT